MDYNNDFAIFILSHNRADNIITLDMLKKYRFSGRWYVVISDDDKQIDEYRRRVGESNLIIFNKESTLEYTNTMLSKKRFVINSSLYARNFIISEAHRRGFKYFVEADDDISRLYHRYDENGKMKQKEISYIDDVLLAMISFVDKVDNLWSLCPALNSGYFGGINGRFKEGLSNYSFQFMLMKSGHPYFDGIMTEDFNMSHIHHGKLFMTYWGLSFDSPVMGSNSGGIDYKKNLNPYTFLLLTSPSSVKLKLENKKVINKKLSFPMILSEEYKKV